MYLTRACDIQGVATSSYLIDGLIPNKAVVLISGPSNAGKSAVLIHLATAFAEGRDAFGSMRVTNPDGRPVVYVNGEMHTSNFKQYAERAAFGIGLQRASAGLLVTSGGRGSLSFGDGALAQFDELSIEMNREKPALVILDTQRALFTIDENSQREVGMIGKSLAYLSEKHDCTFILAHHTRKPGQFQAGAQTAVAGSGYFVGMADSHIALQARDGRFAHRLEVVKDRRASEGGRRAYTLSGTLTNGVSTITLSTASSPHIDKDAERLAKMRAAGPLTRQQLAETGIARRKVFERLRDDRKIVDDGTGKWTPA